MKKFVNAKLCKACGGECCKRIPGIYHPEDFGVQNLQDTLTILFATGKYAVDWWEGDPSGGGRDLVYCVRPATKGKEGQLFDPSWGGECTFLEAEGCALPFDKRPLSCRMLEPVKSGVCIQHIPKRKIITEWIPYQEEILKGTKRC